MSSLDMNSPAGWLRLVEEEGAIVGLHFIKNNDKTVNPAIPSKLLQTFKCELNEYFAGKRTQFSVPLNPKGTEFQRKVWRALQSIPYGETRSYKEIAIAVGNEKASRAVGMANNKNPIAIAIPCHRVIGADGKLVGYAGGMETKIHLLELEKNLVK